MCRRYQILRRGSRIQGLLQLQYALLTFFTLTRNQTLPSHPDASLPGRITPETRWLTTLRCVNSEVPSRRSQDTSDRPPPPPHTQTHTLSLLGNIPTGLCFSPHKHGPPHQYCATQAGGSQPLWHSRITCAAFCLYRYPGVRMSLLRIPL